MAHQRWGGILTPDPAPAGEIALTAISSSCQVNIATPVFQPFNSKDPICILEQRPASFTVPFPGSECMLPVGNGSGTGNPILLHEQFHLGTFLMKADSVEAGIEVLRPVAALWQPNLTGYPDNCQQYIRVAKAFVDASDNMLPGLQRPGKERNQTASSKALVIMPNPASNSALMQLPSGEHQVKVWDAYGNLRLTATASDTYRLETSTWQSGIYFVETVAADGSRMSGKLVVQY